MTKDILIEYCDRQEEIKKLRERIDKLKKQSSMVSDMVQNGYKRRAIIYGIDRERLAKIELQEAKLKRFENNLLDLQIQVEDYIEEIKSSKLREIFRHRYLDNMTWNQIAIKMEYNGESTPRMKHDRFLEENL